MGPAAPALLTVAADSATVTLNQTAALDLAAGSDVGIIAQAGHSVKMSLSAGNIGSVTLRNLSLVLTHHLSDLECSLHDAQDAAPSAAPTAVQPVDGAAIELGVLGVGQVLRCTGRLVLDTAAFEAGDALFSVAGSAAGPGALVAVHSSQEVRVTAAHAPALTVELLVPQALRPFRAREYFKLHLALLHALHVGPSLYIFLLVIWCGFILNYVSFHTTCFT